MLKNSLHRTAFLGLLFFPFLLSGCLPDSDFHISNA